MSDHDPRLDLRALLDAVEAASPTAGVDALAVELGKAVGALEVSFLIIDIGGGALVRLARSQYSGQPPVWRCAASRSRWWSSRTRCGYTRR